MVPNMDLLCASDPMAIGDASAGSSYRVRSVLDLNLVLM